MIDEGRVLQVHGQRERERERERHTHTQTLCTVQSRLSKSTRAIRKEGRKMEKNKVTERCRGERERKNEGKK